METKRFTNANIHFRSKCRVCFSRGGGSQVINAGMMMIEIKNTAMMLSAATTPKFFRTSECVKMKVAKPSAVVKFVNSVAFPTLMIIRCKAIALLPWRLNSAWYLLTR